MIKESRVNSLKRFVHSQIVPPDCTVNYGLLNEASFTFCEFQYQELLNSWYVHIKNSNSWYHEFILWYYKFNSWYHKLNSWYVHITNSAIHGMYILWI